MKKTNTLYSLLILVFFIASPFQLEALSQYLLEEENLEEVTHRIHISHPMASEEAIREYLEAQLHYLPIDPSIPYPDSISVSAPNSYNISFDWAEIDDYAYFQGTYASLSNGIQYSFSSTSSKVDISIPAGYNFHIYSLSTISADRGTQSLVNIFIVDKDVFSTLPPGMLMPPFSNSNSNTFNLTNFPNPFAQQTTFQFQLHEENPAALHLYDPQNQIFYPNIWQQHLLSPGLHEVPLNLSHLPSGTYYGILQINQEQRYLPMIHLGN